MAELVAIGGALPCRETTLVFCPGFAMPPDRYRVLLDVLAEGLGVKVRAYCPPGVGPRRDATGPAHPRQLALLFIEELESSVSSGDRFWCGHSWGCHVARYAAELDGAVRHLSLLDPNLGAHLRRSPTPWSPPAGFDSREDLVGSYASWGIPESRISWDWWRQEVGGRWTRNFDLARMRAYAEARPTVNVIEHIARLSRSIGTTVMRTGGGSVSGNHAWARLRHHAPAATILDLPGVAHGLTPEEQVTVAKIILDNDPGAAAVVRGSGSVQPEPTAFR